MAARFGESLAAAISFLRIQISYVTVKGFVFNDHSEKKKNRNWGIPLIIIANNFTRVSIQFMV